MDADGAARRAVLSRTAKSWRPDTPTLVSSLREISRSDGGNKARLTEETTKETVNHRAGNAGMFRPTCGDYACVLSFFAHKAAGADEAPGIPCALRYFEGDA
jgi:hypothetical protein